MEAGDLSAALWQERRQLELLLFRLETQRLHVAAGNLEWLGFLVTDVETVVDRLRFEALARSVQSAAVASAWGMPAQSSLTELISSAPAGPWPEIMREHLDALHRLLLRIAESVRANEDMLRAVRLPEGPGAEGTAALLDQLTTAENVRQALAVLRRTSQPLLAQYLGGGNSNGGTSGAGTR
jgi:hypothetical protein